MKVMIEALPHDPKPYPGIHYDGVGGINHIDGGYGDGELFRLMETELGFDVIQVRSHRRSDNTVFVATQYELI